METHHLIFPSVLHFKDNFTILSKHVLLCYRMFCLSQDIKWHIVMKGMDITQKNTVYRRIYEGINHCRHIHMSACINIVGAWLAICLVLNLLIRLINIYFLYYNSIQRSQLRFSWAYCCTRVTKGRHWPKVLPVFPDDINELGWRQEQKFKLSQGCAKLKVWSSGLGEVSELQGDMQKEQGI